jgi:hypothetical protein
MKNTYLARKKGDCAQARAYFLEFDLESVYHFPLPTLKLFVINNDRVCKASQIPLLLLARTVSRKRYDWSRSACFRKSPKYFCQKEVTPITYT